jgi:hypothetical protein
MLDGAGHVETIVLHAADYEERLAAFFGRALGS